MFCFWRFSSIKTSHMRTPFFTHSLYCTISLYSVLYYCVVPYYFHYHIVLYNYIVPYYHIALSIQGVPKKRGISEDSRVCFTAQLMLNLGFSFSLHLKIEIHMFVPSTKAFLSDIREPRNNFLKNPINYLQLPIHLS